MARKKSRKIGQIGIRKTPKNEQTVGRSQRIQTTKPKKQSGNPSGSRHSAPESTKVDKQQQPKDPRLGSKKPIALVAEPKESKPAEPKEKPIKKAEYFSPQQELDAIEADAKLSKLLDKLDLGEKLTEPDQQYVEQKMARHQVLCQLLGIKADQPEQAEPEDLLDLFDSANLSEYKND